MYTAVLYDAHKNYIVEAREAMQIMAQRFKAHYPIFLR